MTQTRGIGIGIGAEKLADGLRDLGADEVSVLEHEGAASVTAFVHNDVRPEADALAEEVGADVTEQYHVPQTGESHMAYDLGDF